MIDISPAAKQTGYVQENVSETASSQWLPDACADTNYSSQR
jgi:hypothetical protein